MCDPEQQSHIVISNLIESWYSNRKDHSDVHAMLFINVERVECRKRKRTEKIAGPPNIVVNKLARTRRVNSLTNKKTNDYKNFFIISCCSRTARRPSSYPEPRSRRMRPWESATSATTRTRWSGRRRITTRSRIPRSRWSRKYVHSNIRSRRSCGSSESSESTKTFIFFF